MVASNFLSDTLVTSVSFSDIPRDVIIHHIISYLPVKDIVSFKATSKDMRDFPIWKMLCQRDFKKNGNKAAYKRMWTRHNLYGWEPRIGGKVMVRDFSCKTIWTIISLTGYTMQLKCDDTVRTVRLVDGKWVCKNCEQCNPEDLASNIFVQYNSKIREKVEAENAKVIQNYKNIYDENGGYSYVYDACY